jgi:hypothetical protein
VKDEICRRVCQAGGWVTLLKVVPFFGCIEFELANLACRWV